MPNMQSTRPRDRHSFEIAIFCALGLEADAMMTMFDDVWEQEEQDECINGDTNSYTFGRIHQHFVVLVHMPRMGKMSASNVATNVKINFPCIRVGLLVGICGGVPLSGNHKQDISLGDVIISTHIVQIDFGRLYPHALVRKKMLQDNLGRPNLEIAGFISKLQGQAVQTDIRDSMRVGLDTIFKSSGYPLSGYPGACKDNLFEASYIHKHTDTKICAQCASPNNDVCHEALNMSCAELGCDFSKVIPRAQIQITNEKDKIALSYCPILRFGGLASGDQVIKSASHRDHIAEQEGVIGFEMEAAGLWDIIPTIVVKGVCDYADSHKGKEWQLYAAAAAAACAKGMLKKWRRSSRPIEDRSDYKEAAPSPIHQVFSGNFTAGKNIHSGGTYNAESMNFQ
ncbi:hypothetical protein N7513_001958 [Penicillium frequentans]|nr:hypothetical protein N7513_001958 [Penicillium glabrum]